MDLLERVLGGPKQQTEYRDFIDRFDRGSPFAAMAAQRLLGGRR
jgi:hypothetical protein